jgi:hypothetical protein
MGDDKRCVLPTRHRRDRCLSVLLPNEALIRQARATLRENLDFPHLYQLSLRQVTGSAPTVHVLKNGVFWDVTPLGSCKNRRFGGT